MSRNVARIVATLFVALASVASAQTYPARPVKLIVPDGPGSAPDIRARQLSAKLTFLLRVGLGYLTLGRQTRTLSGGEAQRINLANQLGSQLVGTLYVLDEPSIGLHARDTTRLADTELPQRDTASCAARVTSPSPERPR